MQKANSEGIGLLRTLNRKTKADQSRAEGKGISEATLGLEAQIVVTTRNALAERRARPCNCGNQKSSRP